MPAQEKVRYLSYFSPVFLCIPIVAFICAVMTVYINNKDFQLTPSSNIAAALQSVGIPAGNGTALAVNSNVIPRAQWDTHILNENDKIMIIKATQGG